MEKDLQNSKAVLVDTGAPRLLIEALLEHYILGQCPLILVASQAGCNDRKKQLALQIIEDLGPSVITGSMADIYAISQEVLQRGVCVSFQFDGPLGFFNSYLPFFLGGAVYLYSLGLLH